METLSDKGIKDWNDKKLYWGADVKKFIKDLKQELRGIPPIVVGDPDFTDDQEHYTDTEEIDKRIDKLAGEKLL